MPRRTVYEARIEHVGILDENGNFDAEMARDTLSDEDVRFLYEQMIVSRQFDEIAFKLQRSGRMGTYPQNKGQEAAALGSGFAATKGQDFLVTYFGDGATSEGDFHEAMNFAASFQAPCVFFCQNNQWAISVPRETQTNSETIAQKAIAYGMPGVQCDGNDILAVYKV